MEFFEGFGIISLIILALVVFMFGMYFLYFSKKIGWVLSHPVLCYDDSTQNIACESMGYATEIQLHGEKYCVAFEDGILKRAGILGTDDCKYVIEQEFVLVEVE